MPNNVIPLPLMLCLSKNILGIFVFIYLKHHWPSKHSKLSGFYTYICRTPCALSKKVKCFLGEAVKINKNYKQTATTYF